MRPTTPLARAKARLPPIPLAEWQGLGHNSKYPHRKPSSEKNPTEHKLPQIEKFYSTHPCRTARVEQTKKGFNKYLPPHSPNLPSQPKLKPMASSQSLPNTAPLARPRTFSIIDPVLAPLLLNLVQSLRKASNS
ncbi:hypothetical protein L3X38_027715 [Prunus dulcis]|uniref:Uncharacterized protein n=1 Tax=Prunus dulcis TaxID=3755 RepID=A0AAD4VPR3_PRUDU|nr:hypothetical protein L3X38_027715 [Prunus dulcis]